MQSLYGSFSKAKKKIGCSSIKTPPPSWVVFMSKVTQLFFSQLWNIFHLAIFPIHRSFSRNVDASLHKCVFRARRAMVLPGHRFPPTELPPVSPRPKVHPASLPVTATQEKRDLVLTWVEQLNIVQFPVLAHLLDPYCTNVYMAFILYIYLCIHVNKNVSCRFCRFKYQVLKLAYFLIRNRTG